MGCWDNPPNEENGGLLDYYSVDFACDKCDRGFSILLSELQFDETEWEIKIDIICPICHTSEFLRIDDRDFYERMEPLGEDVNHDEKKSR